MHRLDICNQPIFYFRIIKSIVSTMIIHRTIEPSTFWYTRVLYFMPVYKDSEWHVTHMYTHGLTPRVGFCLLCVCVIYVRCVLHACGVRVTLMYTHGLTPCVDDLHRIHSNDLWNAVTSCQAQLSVQQVYWQLIKTLPKLVPFPLKQIVNHHSL